MSAVSHSLHMDSHLPLYLTWVFHIQNIIKCKFRLSFSCAKTLLLLYDICSKCLVGPVGVSAFCAFSILVPLNIKHAFSAIWLSFPYALHIFQTLPGYLWRFFLCLHWCLCHPKLAIICRCNVWFISPSPGGSLLDSHPAQDIAVPGYLLFVTSRQFLDFGVFIQAGINFNFASAG